MKYEELFEKLHEAKPALTHEITEYLISRARYNVITLDAFLETRKQEFINAIIS